MFWGKTEHLALSCPCVGFDDFPLTPHRGAHRLSGDSIPGQGHDPRHREAIPRGWHHFPSPGSCCLSPGSCCVSRGLFSSPGGLIPVALQGAFWRVNTFPGWSQRQDVVVARPGHREVATALIISGCAPKLALERLFYRISGLWQGRTV